MIRQTGMVENVAGATTLTLTMGTNESARIREINHFAVAAGAEDFSISIGLKKIQQFIAPSLWYLLSKSPITGIPCIYDALKRAGVLGDIPLAKGETLTITGCAASDYLEVVYDLYDGDDVSATEHNGSKSDSYDFIQVISNTAAPTEAGDEILDYSDTDAVFPGFPATEAVPPRMRFDLLALFGSGVASGTGAANGQYTSYLKMQKDRGDMLDKDLVGMLLKGDVSYTTDATVYGTDAGRLSLPVANREAGIIVFPDPIVFRAGEECNVNMTIVETTAASDITANSLKLGMVMRASRVPI
tara:strand:+ start:637 stop:1539 length:903 start_codon:yes stop_codon:yes gene_type:complete